MNQSTTVSINISICQSINQSIAVNTGAGIGLVLVGLLSTDDTQSLVSKFKWTIGTPKV